MLLYKAKIPKMNMKTRLYLIHVYIKVMKISTITCWYIFLHFLLKEGMHIPYSISQLCL